MSQESINSEVAKNIIEGLSKTIDQYLVDGRTYHADITRNKYGSSGGGIYYYENGELFNFANTGAYNSDEFDEHCDKIDNASFEGKELSDLIRFFPVNTKIKFTLEKGKFIIAEAYNVKMLLADLKNDIEKKLKRKSEETHVKTEALIKFQTEADELGMFIDRTEQMESKSRSFDFVMKSDVVKSIYHKLDGKLNSLYFKYENGELNAQADPAYDEHGLAPLTVESIELEPSYKIRKDALGKAKKVRHEFFNSLGNLDDRIFYLRVGGFRDASWPEDSTSHNCCKMRVIYAPESTILITDGLTDIYMSEQSDKNLEYNGIGAEFYAEFHGDIPFEIINEHFMMAFVNSVSQIALRHGDFKKFMLKHGTTTIEFKEENVELWINRDNNANHSVGTFFQEKQYAKKDAFGALLGMESKTVPSKVTFNLEEVLMINVKPFDSSWLTSNKLKSSNNDKVKAAREALIKSFVDSGENNLIPVTYHEEYVQGTPESGGTVMTSVFPFYKAFKY